MRIVREEIEAGGGGGATFVTTVEEQGEEEEEGEEGYATEGPWRSRDEMSQ